MAFVEQPLAFRFRQDQLHEVAAGAGDDDLFAALEPKLRGKVGVLSLRLLRRKRSLKPLRAFNVSRPYQDEAPFSAFPVLLDYLVCAQRGRYLGECLGAQIPRVNLAAAFLQPSEHGEAVRVPQRRRRAVSVRSFQESDASYNRQSYSPLEAELVFMRTA